MRGDLGLIVLVLRAYGTDFGIVLRRPAEDYEITPVLADQVIADLRRRMMFQKLKMEVSDQ